MHVIRGDLIEQALVVGDQQGGVLRCRQLIHATGHDAQRVDVQAGVGFIEDRHHWLEQRHLQNLVALLFTTGEAFIDAALQKGGIHLHHLELLAHMVFELEGVEFLLLPLDPPGIRGHPQKLKIAHPGDLNRVLETEKDPQTSPLLRLQLEQIVAAIANDTGGDAVRRVTGQHLGQRAFAAAVAPHHGMDLPSPHLQIHPFEDGLILHGGMQVSDVEKQLGVRANHVEERKCWNGMVMGINPRIPRA